MLIAIGSQALIRNPEEEKHYALSFDGVDDRIIVPVPSFILSASFTIDFKFKTTNTGIRYVLSRASTSFRFYAGYNDGLFGQLGSTQIQRSNIGASNGGWHHAMYAVTRDHNGDGTMKAFFDGFQVGGAVALSGVTSAVTGPLYIGSAWGTSPSSSTYYNGQLRDLRIWTVDKSDDALDLAENRILSAPGLVASWTLSEGGGNVAYDRSGNSNHGQIVGGTWVEV